MSDTLPSEDAQRALVLRYQGGDNAAGSALLKIHNGMVHAWARRYRHLADMDDLLQEGRMGLLVGLKKYDPARGVKVIAYVTNWIRNYVGRFAANLGGEIRVPVHAQQKARRQDGGEGLRYFRRPPSLDAPIGDPDGSTFGDLMAAPVEDHDARRETEERAAKCEVLLDGLTPREREVIGRRVMADKPERLADIGAEWGLPGKVVRQIEQDAISKLRGVPRVATGKATVASTQPRRPYLAARPTPKRRSRSGSPVYVPIYVVHPMQYENRNRPAPRGQTGHVSAIVANVLLYMDH